MKTDEFIMLVIFAWHNSFSHYNKQEGLCLSIEEAIWLIKNRLARTEKEG